MWPYHRTLNILLAVLTSICNDISWENFIHQEILSLVIISYILMNCIFDYGMTLKRENTCRCLGDTIGTQRVISYE